MTNNTTQIETPVSDASIEENRIQKCEELRKRNINPFVHNYDKKDNINELNEKYKDLAHGDENKDIIKTAGRLMAQRGHGKASFGNIKDDSGKIQIYAKLDILGEELFNNFMDLDIGDIIGIEGSPFVTKRGELSIRVSSVQLLTKSLLPLPEKFHGLQDKETRYRKRYVDLIANDEVKDTFKTRSQTISQIRRFLEDDGFMEVETPVLQHIYGGAAARPFQTHHNTLDQNLYLRIALELPLKRLIVGGFEKVFEIGRVFRNEGVSYKHNPEYTLLELYQAYTDYEDIMKLTETLVSGLVQKNKGSYKLTYQEQEIDFKPPFKRLTLANAIKQYADVDITDKAALVKKAKEAGASVTEKSSIGELINTVYDKHVEHNLIEPTFITDYPWETSPLAKRKRDNDDLVERFELIINGMEIANAFSELNDPIDQLSRFEDQLKAKEAGDEEAHQMDSDYVEALKYGMPPTGGLGIGIDRIVMLLTDSHSIRDVLFFPHMKN
jgi:lysyl-tRNA synthetase, class II